MSWCEQPYGQQETKGCFDLHSLFRCVSISSNRFVTHSVTPSVTQSHHQPPFRSFTYSNLTKAKYISQSCLGNISGISHAYLMHISCISQPCFKHFLGKSKANFRHISGISFVNLMHLINISCISHAFLMHISCIS